MSGYGACLTGSVSFGHASRDSSCITGGLGFEVSGGLSVGADLGSPIVDAFPPSLCVGTGDLLFRCLGFPWG